MDLWLLAIPGLIVAAVCVVVGCLWITADGHMGAHTGKDTYPHARHRATGLDEPTTRISTRGVAHVRYPYRGRPPTG